MRRRSRVGWSGVAACVAVGLALEPVAWGTTTPAANGGWRQAALWDDGKAEFCAYEVTWAHYGSRYHGRALFVLVKEPWAPELDVKADTPRPGGFDVLKFNHARDVVTGIYTYHQMASVYLRRDTGALQKLVASSTEACGVSTADMTRGELRTRSYFDGQADRAMRWPQGAVPEDGLPASLRDYVTGVCPPTLAVFPSLLSGRFANLTPVLYQMRRQAVGRIEVPAGAFEGVEVRLESPSGWLAYVFEVAPPHRLLRFQRDDGTEYVLARGERIAYWEMHEPGAEAWLPAAVR